MSHTTTRAGLAVRAARPTPLRLAVRERAPRTIDRTFPALGTDVRLVVTARRAAELVARAEREILDYDARLSRFRPDSELCALNADPREEVPASPLLREAVGTALWAAQASGGLVDPTLLDALERAGYRESLAQERGRSPDVRRRSSHIVEARLFPDVLAWSDGGGRPARPHPASRWREISVGATTISRPPGLRLDLGGSGKGHVADRVARILHGAERWFVDCGGDVRVGGAPQEVHVAHPLTGEVAEALFLEDEAIATSSSLARAWTTPDGRRAHHLLDPSTGEPAHTGLVAVTARGRTTLEAETRAKAVLLRGARTPGGDDAR
jgi:thiamine biosynthesis lipoprotein